MRDPRRIKGVLAQLEDFWVNHPDLRLGQIIMNVYGVMHPNELQGDPFYMEEDELLEGLRKLWKLSDTSASTAKK